MFWSQWCIKLLYSKHIFVWNFLLSNLLINLIYLWISWTDLWIRSQTFVTYLEKNHFEKIKFIYMNFYFSFPRRIISRKNCFSNVIYHPALVETIFCIFFTNCIRRLCHKIFMNVQKVKIRFNIKKINFFLFIKVFSEKSENHRCIC